MKIHQLRLQNFKKYETLELDLHPQFTLLVGDNGSGKTSLLDALAVALNIWHMNIPDSSLLNSRRTILRNEIRLAPSLEGDRWIFRECKPVSILVSGDLLGQTDLHWEFRINEKDKQSSKKGQETVRDLIDQAYDADNQGLKPICPVVAYYGAGRAWLPSNRRVKADTSNQNLTKRWSALYDSLKERIRLDDIQEWFLDETIEAGNRQGKMRPGFEVVKQAVLGCIPHADNLWYSTDFKQIVLSIEGKAQPFNNLSAGQKMMLALVADIAIKAVTQNAFLLPPDQLEPADFPIPRIFQQTPGVILIDELDVHLHPKWQRRVASDLKRTFPAMQFVCTSHSPQVIGEVQPEEIRILNAENQVESPSQSFGMDSNWILDVLMQGQDRNADVEARINQIFQLIATKQLDQAESEISTLESEIGKSKETTKAFATLRRIKLLGK